MERNQLQTEH